jgi:septal ring factor EnvC (AmiA/AmiB activator)
VVLTGLGDVYLATRLVRSNDHVASLEDALDRSRADAQSARSELTGTKSRLDAANAQLTQTRGKLNNAETKLAACHRAVSRYLDERRDASAAGKPFFTPTRTTIRRIVSCFLRTARIG